jgi:ABC-type uncharacterized transport system YnjBCD ATPase subunit
MTLDILFLDKADDRCQEKFDSEEPKARILAELAGFGRVTFPCRGALVTDRGDASVEIPTSRQHAGILICDA